MKNNTKLFIALCAFYIIVALLALLILNGHASVFNRDKKNLGAEPSVMDTQTVAGDVNETTEEEAQIVESEPEPAPVETVEETEPEIEITPEPEPEPVVYEKRYFSFRTTNKQADLRFRTEPSEDADIITKLYNNTFGYITKPGNKWCKVVMSSGREGYLATEYLAVTELTEETFPEQYLELVEAPEEELTVSNFTTDLVMESEDETTPEDSADAAADPQAGTETAQPADGSTTAQPATDTTAQPATDTTAQPAGSEISTP